MSRSWTSDEDRFVRDNYGAMSPADIAAHLGRTSDLVVWRAGMLGVRKPRNPAWTDAENEFLRDSYPTMPDEEISARLGRSLAAINHQAGRKGITKTGPSSDWTEDEDELFGDLYATMATDKLADLLGRSPGALVSRAMRLGISRRPRRPDRRAVERTREETVLTMRWDCVQHDYFAHIDSPMKAYVLGWLASDGCVGRNTNRIILRLNSKDEEILHLIRQELAPLHPIIPYQGRRPSGEMSSMVSFEVGSERMRRDLIKLGVTPKKSLTLQYPPVLACFDNSFILGYFDGDGSLFKVDGGRRWKWTITCASRPLLMAVQQRIKAATGVEPHGPHLHDKARSPHTHHLAITGARIAPIDAWLHADVPGLARKRLPQS
jgi:hypothetical protein